MNKISILIVEDQVSLLDRLEKSLSIFCDTIYKATNGLEALEIHKQHHPNIILTDIDMPKLNGVELVQEVRKTDTNTQLIILSAHTNTEDFLKVVPLNLVSYLVKPVKIEQLKQVILQAIKNLSNDNYINLNNGYIWNIDKKCLQIDDKKIELTNYENAFIEILVLHANFNVSYEDIHNYIYNLEEYSQDALFTLVKRIRKKTTKEFIKSAFKHGYIIESM